MPQTERAISNTLAGVLIAVMNITVAISVAALMFAGMDAHYLSYGIVVLLIGTLVVGMGGTLFSGFGAVICAPRSGLAPVFATIVSGVSVTLGAGESSQHLATILMAIMITSIVTGIFLLLLGRLRLGNLVRYIPYPVMGGFFAGIGFIFVKGGLTVAIGQPPGLDVAGDMQLLQLALSAILFAAVLLVVLARFDHWSSFPAALVLGFAVFYMVFYLTGQDFNSATRAGWLPGIESTPGLLLPLFTPADLGNVNWLAITGQAGGILVAALLSAIILLLDISGIELITKKDLSPDRELKVMGMTNILSGIAGGYPGVHVASDTAFTFKLGGDSRLMGFVYAGVVVLALLAGTDFIGKVPTFILGGLLIFVGLGFLIDWVWKMRSRLPLADYLIVLVILGVIAYTNILKGVAFGFAVAVVLFVINYSRLTIVKNEWSGRARGSNVDRDLETRELLNEQGERILILALQGFIFFGTSDKLITEIKRRVELSGMDKLDFLVLDFQYVSQLDTSAVQAFMKLAQLGERYEFHIIVTGAEHEIKKGLEDIGFLDGDSGRVQRIWFDQIDDGIAWCEEQILSDLAVSGQFHDCSITNLLEMALGDKESAGELAPYFKKAQFSKGEYLFHQGEEGDSLYIVGKGSVAVVIESGSRERVLRHYRSGAILGEMSLYTGDPRSASIKTEEDSVLYRLDALQLRNLQQHYPQPTARLHAYIVRVLSERMDRANRELQRYM